MRVFSIVAQHGTISGAAEELHLTKGAVSYQIKQLEQALGFLVFERLASGVVPTAKGQELLTTAQAAFISMEQRIGSLRNEQPDALTIGVTTYFASRWLSPKLMGFMQAHPEIRLRIQPMVDAFDLDREDVDLSIRWGNGNWNDVAIEPLFQSSTWPTGNLAMFKRIDDVGHRQAFAEFTLLRDHEKSSAWSEWYAIAGQSYRGHTETLIIPDPNVRVQAVIDGQGIALNDALVSSEIDSKQLYRLSNHDLANYGYFLVYKPGALSNPGIRAFAEWIKQEV